MSNTLLIVDPWLWLVLAVQQPRHRHHTLRAARQCSTNPAPAQIALSSKHLLRDRDGGMGMESRAASRRASSGLGGSSGSWWRRGPLAAGWSRCRGARSGSFAGWSRPRVQAASLRRFPGPHPARSSRWTSLPRLGPVSTRLQTDTSATARSLVHLIDLRYRAGAFGHVAVPLPNGNFGSVRCHRIRISTPSTETEQVSRGQVGSGGRTRLVSEQTLPSLSHWHGGGSPSPSRAVVGVFSFTVLPSKYSLSTILVAESPVCSTVSPLRDNKAENLGPTPWARSARAPLSDEVYRQVLQRIHRGGDLGQPAAELVIPTQPLHLARREPTPL